MSVEHFDVLIVGAGVSGIGAGYYLQQRCPSRRYAILEGRSDLGGTWSLFRYPGVRSDSDMFTLGYSPERRQADQAAVEGMERVRLVHIDGGGHNLHHDELQRTVEVLKEFLSTL